MYCILLTVDVGGNMPGALKFQVGKFTCELSVGDGGKVHTVWLPRQPKYLQQSGARAISRGPRRVLHGTACPRRPFDTLRPVFSGSGGMRPGKTEVNHVRLA